MSGVGTPIRHFIHFLVASSTILAERLVLLPIYKTLRASRSVVYDISEVERCASLFRMGKNIDK